MSARYRIDCGGSRFTVQGFASGMLSFLAHSPTFAVRSFQGELCWSPDSADAALDMTIESQSLELIDNVRAADRQEIEGRMRQEVLQVGQYPQSRIQADEIETVAGPADRYRLCIVGLVLLRGVQHREEMHLELRLYSDGVRLTGKHSLRLSDYGIPAVTALGGAIRLLDELELSFDIIAWKEAS